jgi:hypothetical protein
VIPLRKSQIPKFSTTNMINGFSLIMVATMVSGVINILECKYISIIN